MREGAAQRDESAQTRGADLWVQSDVYGRKLLTTHRIFIFCGGWGGIRTHGELAPTPVFKTGAFNRSATHPALFYLHNLHRFRQLYCRSFGGCNPFATRMIRLGYSAVPATFKSH